MLKRIALASLVFTLAAAASDISPKRYLDNVKYLASDELKGRGNSLPELQKAARYIEGQFKTCGLKPVNGSYFQKYNAMIGAEPGPNNKLEGFVNGTDFKVLGLSDSAKFSGPLVFAGYGISWAPHYDDYAGINAKGKVVLVLRRMPAGNKMFEPKATLIEKALTAKSKGAVAVLLVNDTADDDFIRFDSVSGPEHLGIPYLQLTRAAADRLLKDSGRKLADWQAEIDKEMEPRSKELTTTVTGESDVLRKMRELENVAGLLPGSDAALKDQVIVIGAHYDHLGLGDSHSLAPDKMGEIHHGADDNASGTAGVIELACSLAHAKHQRSLLFLTFSGEELGLYGSDYYAKHPLLPIDKVEAMLNLDMIGRVKDGKLYIGDIGTAAEFKAIVDEESKSSPLRIESSSTGTDSSDHLSFVLQKVPSLFFFSGLHADYHKPSDTWDKIDPQAAAEVLDLVQKVALRLDRLAAPPQFVKIAEPPRPVGGGGGSGYGPYFGSIPDMGESSEKGVRFADIRAGSPADVAGLKAGDVMIDWDGEAINNLYDFTHQLQNKKVGDRVRITVMRDGQKITKDVTLTKRP